MNIDCEAIYDELDQLEERTLELVQGDLKKTYYEGSKWAEVEAYEVGFIVHNLVTGIRWPFATWQEAKSKSWELMQHYENIERGAGW